MHFTTEAELRLDALTAMGDRPAGGEVLIFTPDDAEAALAREYPPWVSELPASDYWSEHAPDGARWYGVFRATDQGRVPSPPPSRGDTFELLYNGESYPGVIVNEALGEGSAAVTRYFLAGTGEAPARPDSPE